MHVYVQEKNGYHLTINYVFGLGVAQQLRAWGEGDQKISPDMALYGDRGSDNHRPHLSHNQQAFLVQNRCKALYSGLVYLDECQTLGSMTIKEVN